MKHASLIIAMLALHPACASRPKPPATARPPARSAGRPRARGPAHEGGHPPAPDHGGRARGGGEVPGIRQERGRVQRRARQGVRGHRLRQILRDEASRLSIGTGKERPGRELLQATNELSACALRDPYALPYTGIDAPWMTFASALHRNTITRAMSSGFGHAAKSRRRHRFAVGFGVDDAGQHRIHAHAGAREVGGERIHQRQRGGLRRGVHGGAARRIDARLRRDVDDRPLPLFQHRGHGGAQQRIVRPQVQCQHPVERIRGDAPTACRRRCIRPRY